MAVGIITNARVEGERGYSLVPASTFIRFELGGGVFHVSLEDDFVVVYFADPSKVEVLNYEWASHSLGCPRTNPKC